MEWWDGISVVVHACDVDDGSVRRTLLGKVRRGPYAVLEVQRDDDPDKKFSWPVYVTVVRARKRCATIVLVVAPNAAVATWAASSIDLGLGLGNLKPLVLGPLVVPEVTDQARATRRPTFRSSTMRCVSPYGGPWRR